MKRTALLGALLFVLLLALPGSTLASSSSCQTYNPQNCKTTTTSTAPTTTTATTTSTPTATVEPATTTSATSSSLPFTGVDVGLLVAGGLLLCAGGLAVRRLSRRFE